MGSLASVIALLSVPRSAAAWMSMPRLFRRPTAYLIRGSRAGFLAAAAMMSTGFFSELVAWVRGSDFLLISLLRHEMIFCLQCPEDHSGRVLLSFSRLKGYAAPNSRSYEPVLLIS